MTKSGLITLAFLLVFSCSDSEAPTVSNNFDSGDLNLPYELNLERTDSGEGFFSAAISWIPYSGADFDHYHLYSEAGFDYITDTINVSFHDFTEMDPGEFRDIYLEVVTASDTGLDSVQIFTRPMLPATNFDFTVIIADSIWHRYLTWTPSQENSGNFLKYTIFRSGNKYDLKNLSNCNCELEFITNQFVSSFTDTTTVTPGINDFYYLLQTRYVSTTGEILLKNSFIPNTNYNSLSTVALSSGSNYEKDFIELIWTKVNDPGEDDFYHYEVWRSGSSSFSDPILLATIDDINQTRFTDRYYIGSGHTWYYKVMVYDISGRDNSSSPVSGSTLP